MARIGRPPSCLCGECGKCKRRARARERYQSLSLEERRAYIARRDRERVRANDRARYYRDKPKRIELAKKWRRKNPDKVYEIASGFRERNPEKRLAHSRVSDAIRSGRLVKQPCVVCGSEVVHAHHDDYSKPLDVLWLCPQHHSDRHKQMRAAAPVLTA